MPNYRRGRINEEMSRELASILREIKDPRVSENFISITNVDVTPDLKYAKIGFSSMTGDKAEIKKGLVSVRPREKDNSRLRQDARLPLRFQTDSFFVVPFRIYFYRLSFAFLNNVRSTSRFFLFSRV